MKKECKLEGLVAGLVALLVVPAGNVMKKECKLEGIAAPPVRLADHLGTW